MILEPEDDQEGDHYFSDEPIASKAQDRFGRALFAACLSRRFAESLPVDPRKLTLVGKAETRCDFADLLGAISV